MFGSDAATNGFLDITENSRAVLILGTNLSATHPFSYKLQTAVCGKASSSSSRARSPPRSVESPTAPSSTSPARMPRCSTGWPRSSPTEARRRCVRGRPGGTRRVARGSPDLYARKRVGCNGRAGRDAPAGGRSLRLRGREGGRGDDGLYPPQPVYSQALTLRPGGEAIDHAAAASHCSPAPPAARRRCELAQDGGERAGRLDMGCAPFLLPGEAPIEDSEARARMEQIWSLDEPLSAQPGPAWAR
ncbi:MAG: hypothetical protein WKH64_11715 [Chloroflexia bacterium]